MNINLTLIGQSITFALFVWFCMKFIWSPIVSALEARKKQIADGLAAADRGKHELELAAKRASESLHHGKGKRDFEHPFRSEGISDRASDSGGGTAAPSMLARRKRSGVSKAGFKQRSAELQM